MEKFNFVFGLPVFQVFMEIHMIDLAAAVLIRPIFSVWFWALHRGLDEVPDFLHRVGHLCVFTCPWVNHSAVGRAS